MQMTQLMLGVVFGGMAACTHAADLRDGFRMSDYHLPFVERLRIEGAAPVIVLGRVLAVTNVGSPQKSPGDPRIKTQLTQIRIDVEETIKSSIRRTPIDFYFFAYSSENEVDLGVPRYVPEVGQRRVYFLKPWADTYRSVGDVTSYSLPVHSGTHARGFCQGKDPGCCIAEILLVPEQDVDVQWFLHDLGPSSAYAAGTLCSPRRAQELIRSLTQSPDARIAGSATYVMPVLEQWWPQLKAGQ